MASAERGAAGRRRLAFVAAPMLLSLFLAAMDSTVVGTLLPTIRAQMHDVDLFPWLLSGFLLAAALVIPIAGTLADRLGDRAVMLASLAAFAAGSAAICLAPTMAWLVGARILQGAGAGGITVMAYVMLGRAFAGDSRARMQGLLSTVWGLAAILGPSLGLAVQAQLGWRAVFAINVPVVAVAFVLVLRLGHRRPDGAPATSAVDARAFLLLTILLCALLLLVMSPGLSLGDGVGRVLALVWAVSLGLHVAYVRPPGSRRRGLPPRAARCVLPLPMLVERRYVVAGLLTLLAAAVLYGSVTLLPLYLNALDGPSALDRGTVVTLGALGWVVGSAVCGMLLGRLGFRAMSVIGGALLTAGAGLLWAATA